MDAKSRAFLRESGCVVAEKKAARQMVQNCAQLENFRTYARAMQMSPPVLLLCVCFWVGPNVVSFCVAVIVYSEDPIMRVNCS